MLNDSGKWMLALTAVAIGTALLAGGTYERAPENVGCLKLEKSADGTWEYVKAWHDGYNLHPYAKIRVKIGPAGTLRPERDNATGLILFEEVSEAEYNAARCARTI